MSKKYIASIYGTGEDGYSRGIELIAANVYEAHKRAYQHLDLSKHEEVRIIEEVYDDGTTIKVYDSQKGFI